MNNTLLIVEALASGGFIWIITNEVKKLHPVLARLAPVIALILGVSLGLIIVTLVGGLSVNEGILAGLFIAGITSSTYAQTKKLKSTN